MKHMHRTNAFMRQPSTDEYLAGLNQLVLQGEQRVAPRDPTPVPLVLVLGAPRSGTTLLTQWMAANGLGYPSNLAARFWQVPYFAGQLQRLLTDPALHFRDELAVGETNPFESQYGKTSGILSVHEFSFFVRQFFPVTVGERVLPELRQEAAVHEFLRAVSLFGHGLGRAVAMKGLLLQYELDWFRGHDHVLLIHVYRNEIANACSILKHREKVAGDRNEWISVRPPEFTWLRDLPATQQVAGQVFFTNRWIQRQLTELPISQSLSVSHEEFCEAPNHLYEHVRNWLVGQGWDDIGPYDGPRHFIPSSTHLADSPDSTAVAEAFVHIKQAAKSLEGGIRADQAV